MADNSLPPVPYDAPIEDGNGFVNRTWAVWFRQVFNRLGGFSSATLADLASHLSSTSGAHPAQAITNTPSGNLVSTNVQSALNFLQSEMDTINTEASSGAFNGLTAYQVALLNGFVGTQAQWLASLVGATGSTGATGSIGPQGATGPQGPEGPPGGAINTQFTVSNTGFIYSNSLTGHVYLMAVAT